MIKIEWSRNGADYHDIGVTADKIKLGFKEYLKVTYSSDPTLRKVPY